MAAYSRPALVRNGFINVRRGCCIYRPQHAVRIQRRFQTIQAEPSSTLPLEDSSSPPPLSPPPPPPPSRSRTFRFFGATALFLFATTASLVMSVAPAAETIIGFIQPPTNAETLTMVTTDGAKAEEINEHIMNNALAKSLRADPAYIESRPHLKIPESMRAHNLTGGTLLGEDKIAVPPLTFCNTKAELPSLIQISHLGPSLCGHPGIIHGGLLATLLDEGLARACFPALPNKVGVTASLTINYKLPCPANHYVVLRAETTKVDGRKAWVKGWIELLGEGTEEGAHLVEAEALFIEPRGAKNMAKLYASED